MSRLKDRHVVVSVDDEPGVLRALERVFHREPFVFLCTERPVQALDWVERTAVSLILTDQRMPEMAGTELLQRVWRSRPDTTRAVLTAYPGSLILPGYGPTPIQHAFLKPWNDERLKRAVRRLLRAREFEEVEGERIGHE